MIDEYSNHRDEPLWTNFNHTSVRDLAWVLFSPPMFNTSLTQHSAFNLVDNPAHCLAWLEQLDNSSTANDIGEQSPLNSALPHRSGFSRLGLYFEALLAFYFTAGANAGVSSVSLICRNLQIASPVQGRTIGELDFLLKANSGAVIHLEVAVKYYLSITNEADTTDSKGGKNDISTPAWDQWVGPNAKDRLDLKVRRMLDHQLPLPEKERLNQNFIKSLQSLATEGDAEPLKIKESLFLMAGVAFNEIPASAFCNSDAPLDYIGSALDGEETSTLSYPENGNPLANKALWLRLSTLKERLLKDIDMPNQEHSWVIYEKMEWLTGPHPITSARRKSSQALYDALCDSEFGEFFSGALKEKTDKHILKGNTRGSALYLPFMLMMINHNETGSIDVGETEIGNSALRHTLMVVHDDWPEINSPSRMI